MKWLPLRSSHVQWKDYFYFRIAERLQTLRYSIFTGEELPQSKPDGFDSSLWEGASGETAHFAIIASQEISVTIKQHICDMQFNAVAVALKS